MDKYRGYLAANVLHESRVVSYRLLSRVLKVHVNLAKQMLYEFHASQNARKPGSVHATYLVTGTKRTEAVPHTNGKNREDGEDIYMRSSPFRSSPPAQDRDTTEQSVKTTTITLVREENLEELKAQYIEITSIHIYSLEPGPLKDLQVLSDCNREIITKHPSKNPLESWKIYGTIYNPHVKRRSGAQPPPAPAPVATTTAAKSAPRPSSTMLAKPKQPEDTLKNESHTAAPQVDAAAMPSKNAEAKAPTLRREGSNIFKSFAKAKPKKTSAASEPTTPATESVDYSATEDVPMKDDSEEEGEDDDIVFTSSSSKSKEVSEAARKAKAEREENLRKMMDEDDDEPMEDAPPPALEEPLEPEAPIDQQPKPEEEKQEATVTVSGGRRRGRRRVMKKKTVKDEEGYLVTKEEPVWESFSEDEPEPKKLKLPSTSATTAKAKKGATKGQGSIMSFFAKK